MIKNHYKWLEVYSLIFVYKYWEIFCKELKEKGVISIPAREVNSSMESYLVLKHDIENSVHKALQLAEIEYRYGHRGTFYAHAYLIDSKENVKLLQKIESMGHEVSYHYDVMDSNKGDIDKAINEFKFNIGKFESLGFKIKTVCQHGNPVVERVGYTSNRDFFRDQRVQMLYPNIADIMVDFKKKYQIEYTYFSDAGRKFKMIYDPINNDIVNSDDKNIPYENLFELLNALPSKAIISTHPHRWTDSAVSYIVKEKTFKIIKFMAKLAMKVPGAKKLMSRYYYLAKKI